LADKEHPASKAGRYVRAAGIVIGKEIDRRAAAAAAKPAPAAPPPPPPPPPPAPATTLAGNVVFGLFLLSLAVLGLTILHFTDLVPHSAARPTRIVLAGIMLFEAFLLTTNWHRANERLAQRLLTRMWGPRGPVTKRERFVARAIRDVLVLVGIGFLAAGVFQLLEAFLGTATGS
jgi:hypothetical protein